MMAKLQSSKAFYLAFGGIIFFFVFLVSASYRLVEIERGLDLGLQDDLSWTVTQMQYESVRFSDSVLRLANRFEGSSSEEVTTRYNSLLSRLQVFVQGQPRTATADPVALRDVDFHMRDLAAIGPIVNGLKAGDLATAETIVRRIIPLTALVRDVANATMLSERKVSAALRDQRRWMMAEASGYLVGIMVSGLILAALVLRSRNQILKAAESLRRERELSRVYRTLVAMVAHQFGTPLSIIDFSAQRMNRRGTAMTAEEIAERTGHIRDAIAGLVRLMNMTLKAAHFDLDQITFDRRSTDLAALVEGICERHRHTEPGRLISAETDATMPPIFCDPLLIEEAVSHLISNALKYSGNEPIIVRTRLEGEVAAIEVEDTGVGIPTDEAPRIFEEMFRARTAEKEAGSGIGLSVSRQIARLHGGEIGFVTKEGVGSTFTLRIPLRGPDSLSPEQI